MFRCNKSCIFFCIGQGTLASELFARFRQKLIVIFSLFSEEFFFQLITFILATMEFCLCMVGDPLIISSYNFSLLNSQSVYK